MITKITGVPIAVSGDTLTLAVGAFEYEILIPEFARRNLQDKIGREVSLHTVEYLEGNADAGPADSAARRLSQPDRARILRHVLRSRRRGRQESVAGDGAAGAGSGRAHRGSRCQGTGDAAGVGPATAERIIAKLRRKVPKFALLVARDTVPVADVERDLLSEAYEVLRVLGHSESDARRLLDDALDKKGKYKDVDSLLHAIYEKRAHGD